MDEWKKNRTISQTISVMCATCGDTLKVNNREEKTPFILRDNELLFNCPNCKYIYDVPIRRA